MNIKDILEKKLQWFSLYEVETLKMYEANVYENAEYMRKRDEYAAEIDKLDLLLNSETMSDVTLSKVLNCDCDRNTLDENYLGYFDVSLKIFSCKRRISELNDMIRNNFQAEMDYLTEEIKKENKGSNAAYAKYSGALTFNNELYTKSRKI
ncbi:MAG: hypothetical protein LBM93_14060 [Oscillospiraceae bacterium]|jgi:hypothetical protein|nr:hypothetical protein [Oscillospiraceae bacterium]